jgi:hypothetical protein
LPSYLPLGPGLPEFAVEIAFTTLPTADPQVWTNATPYVRALSIRRGRQDELARVETGTLDLLLDNRDARFNPENTSSPYYPNLVPKRQVRVLARSGATTATLFTGFCGGFPQEWPDAGTDAIVRLGAVDLMGLLARLTSSPPTPSPRALDPAFLPLSSSGVTVELVVATPYWPTTFPYTITIESEDMTVTAAPSSTSLTVTRGANGTTAVAHENPPFGTLDATTPSGEFPSQTTGARITDVITSALWQGGLSVPGGYFANVATGRSTMVATGPLSEGTSPPQLIQQAVDSENGLFYAGGDGLPVFHDRYVRLLNQTVTASFGEIPPETTYADIGVSHDEGQLYNIVNVNLPNGVTRTRSDSTSQAAYWPSVLTRESQTLAAEGADLASYLLSRFKDPQLRIPDIALDGHNVAGALLIGFDLDQRYTVKRRPASGTAIVQDGFVEGISHTLGPAEWTTTLNLSPADFEEYWVLGTSQLGVNTRLAY